MTRNTTFTAVLSLGIFVAVSGCVAQGNTLIPPKHPAQGQCDHALVTPLIGKDASALDALDFSGRLRVILPGMAVTKDYFATRTNVDIDKLGAIKHVWCG